MVRPSAAPALVPLAGALLADADDGVRYRAAHLLAVLGSRAAPYADRLAELLDDPGEAEFLEGTVGDHARWALTRIGDPRGLPGLVERLYEPYRGQYSRSYVMGDPRLPEVEDVLTPLGAHADVLLPAVRELLRDADTGITVTRLFLGVLTEWGQAAVPALPEAVALLDDTAHTFDVVGLLVAMGPAAQSAAPAVRRITVFDYPAKHWRVAWAAWRLGGDHDATLRLLGEAVLAEEGPLHGPVALLGDFGPAAAPYADRVRHVMEHGSPWARLRAAVALWSITGEPEPSVSVLEENIHEVTDGGDSYGVFLDALRALARIGTVTPAARAALHTVQGWDRRLSPDRDYRSFLLDEEIRSAIDDVLALP
ncbi:HEAT repeat domain-containing protein [Streptomyces sp. NPDC020362]|uniref:HEAT repeat domain-containing protein n=1 Tax=unclassified Streptomyces TaxID=2593676 RepID=UPI003407710B